MPNFFKYIFNIKIIWKLSKIDVYKIWFLSYFKHKNIISLTKERSNVILSKILKCSDFNFSLSSSTQASFEIIFNLDFQIKFFGLFSWLQILCRPKRSRKFAACLCGLSAKLGSTTFINSKYSLGK